jgi:glucose/arabinose dehydrogenase
MRSFVLVLCTLTMATAADRPGETFSVDPANLPRPFATPPADNGGNMIARPNGSVPQVPPGFAVDPYVTGLSNPRFMALGPDGVFVAESRADKITLIRGGHAEPFLSGFHYPHGLAVRGGALYVGDLDAVWRVDLKTKQRARITRDSFGTRTYHITRDIAFDRQGTLYVAIGSANNVAEEKPPQATIQKVSPDGHMRTFAAGLRNPVGLAFHPDTDDLYVTADERDGYGDRVPPDFFSAAKEGDFFGWPYAYAGPHPDPQFGGKRPDLVKRTKTPDVLFPAHSTALGIVFYTGTQFPPGYRGDAFVALHGSWNTAAPTGYKVVRIRFRHGRPDRGYRNFATGFWSGGTSPPQVWGRPAGLLVDKDGSLLIADDQGRTIWRVRYTGK